MRKAFIATIIAALAWGAMGTVGEFLFLKKAMNPLWLSCLRLCLGGTILLLFARWREGSLPSIELWRKPKTVAHLFAFSVLGSLPCQYGYMQAIRYSDAGTATMLEYIAPVLIMLIVAIKEKRRPKSSELLALLCVTIGVFFIATGGRFGNLNVNSLALAWGLYAAFGVAMHSLLPISLIHRYGTAAITGWGMLIGGIVLSLSTRPTTTGIVFDYETILGLVAIILIGTVFAFAVYLYGVATLGAAPASMIASLEPIAAAACSAFFLGTYFPKTSLIGFVLIIIALFLLAYTKSKISTISSQM